MTAWTRRQALRLDSPRFEFPHLQVVYDEYRASLGFLADREVRLMRAIHVALTTLVPK